METLKLFLCGDVMLGRGIDQIMQHRSNPKLYEPYITDARDYLYLAEQCSGPIPREVSPDYVWGDALSAFRHHCPDLKIINLETSITRSNNPWPNKGIHYRMHPANTHILTTAKIDCCALANNHVLDWGQKGLLETITSLENAGISYCGAGKNIAKAQEPAIFPNVTEGRILVFSMGLCSSGIPKEWAAMTKRPGVWLLEDLSEKSISLIKNIITNYRQPKDICIVSIHWGENWGYTIPEIHQHFAHALIDEVGIDVIHGHSSHHPIGNELYNNKSIFYGCGDFINDYEGIGGYEEYRANLSLMYFLSLDKKNAHFKKLELVPMGIRQFKVNYANQEEREWILKCVKNTLSQCYLHILPS
jgi:poly-gamma-glutamate synthesis protein (capsule biosynthesis protein)